MRKVLFLDRDGTLVKEPSDYLLDAWEKLVFYPGALFYLSKIVRELDYELVMITNQDGLGTAVFPEASFWPIHNFILETFAGEGIHFSEVFIDRTYPEDGAPTRKPGTALLRDYLKGDYDLKGSYVIGDRLTDMALAKNMGCQGIWINTDPELGADELSDRELSATISLETTDWADIYEEVKSKEARLS